MDDEVLCYLQQLPAKMSGITPQKYDNYLEEKKREKLKKSAK